MTGPQLSQLLPPSSAATARCRRSSAIRASSQVFVEPVHQRGAGDAEPPPRREHGARDDALRRRGPPRRGRGQRARDDPGGRRADLRPVLHDEGKRARARRIGLWVSRNIVEEQHGTMTVLSTPGVGTVFTIRLTGLHPTWICRRRGRRRSRPASSRGTILFVDDEPMLLNAFARAFEERHECSWRRAATRRSTSCGTAAAGSTRSSADLLMPQMSGMALYDEIGERFPQLLPKMAFMSGGAFTPSAREFVERVDNPKIAEADLARRSGAGDRRSSQRRVEAGALGWRSGGSMARAKARTIRERANHARPTGRAAGWLLRELLPAGEPPDAPARLLDPVHPVQPGRAA